MKLRQLLASLKGVQISPGIDDAEITGITSDSRRVLPGNLFVAIPGLQVDGHRFVPDALRRGAAAIVGQCPSDESPTPVTAAPLSSRLYVPVPDSRLALAFLAAAFHGNPGRCLRVIGVTGTDGKTTTVQLIAAILDKAGHPTGMVNTVGAVLGDETMDTGFHTTTPEAPEVQAYLARMVSAGMEYAVLESTSHGLSQHRVTGCEFDVAVITNVTHEHLDYHGSFDAYRDAKASLFRMLTSSHRKEGAAKVSVLNADDDSFERFRAIRADMRLSYGLESSADVVAEQIELTAQGSRFLVRTPIGSGVIETALPGRFNVSNVLAAVSVAISQGVSLDAIRDGISGMTGVTGRMDRIEEGQNFTLIIDFAHTPNALRRALEAVRSSVEGRVIVVFGCAGLRDRGKRAVMGEIAGTLADCTVITAEDPRTESLDEIMGQIARGCERAGRRERIDYWRIGDRAEAIQHAVDIARPGDLVIVTGKGHEQSMCFGTSEYPWSDHEAARAALRKTVGRVS